MATAPYKTLRLILGDQLNSQHHWFQQIDHTVTYVLMEVRSETDYVTHHIQKIIGFFAAMQQFAAELQAQGHQVIYLTLNDPHNLQQIDANCLHLINTHHFTRFEYQLPDEYRLEVLLQQLTDQLTIPVTVVDTEHFYTTRNELSTLFAGKKQFLMETFYRYMRKKHRILVVDDQQPLHGKWNFDEANRQKLPANHQPTPPLLFSNNVSPIAATIAQAGIASIGSVDALHFFWPINRAQSLELLNYFVTNCLPLFGTFQDAMAPGAWSVYHSRLSFSLNLKMLSPQEVVNKAIEAYTLYPQHIAYHQLEGFVRQIVGWREYMRGMYWMQMPIYATLNFLGHTQKLPTWFWTGNTHMNCLKHTIRQSLEYAYAHHIQRLMITGNFALLAGVHPTEVDAWYLGIYIDAIEWVQITNTRGMSQFADGGMIGTKPYVSTANYIQKMSHYCTNCQYKPTIKTGDKACPFNSLYWHFHHQHAPLLANNPRIGMTYTLWNKMDPQQQNDLLAQAKYYLEHIEEL